MYQNGHNNHPIHDLPLHVNSPNVSYLPNKIISQYQYQKVGVEKVGSTYEVTPESIGYTFETDLSIKKLGVLLVGFGGNNGSTFLAGILANKGKINWRTKTGVHDANYIGSMLLSSSINLGMDKEGHVVNIPLQDLLPMNQPTHWEVGGWDISSKNLAEAMVRAQVLDVQLQDQLYHQMEAYKPMKAVYKSDFIATNQSERADNILEGTLSQALAQIRFDIRSFKEEKKLDKVIVLWTASTERFSQVLEGVADTKEALFQAISNNHAEISPSVIYAVAAILEGCSYINGSPQNTFLPGVVALAIERDIFIGGDDFKSGQTKFKSVLVDFLISAGLKLRSVASYNHLGNNDGYNLSHPEQFRTKEVSKSSLIDSMVLSNTILYKPDERPDHLVVIKYQPYVGDTKRAMDEYISEIFLSGNNTIVVHNTCEDSLLAVPLMYDMICLTELSERIKIGPTNSSQKPQKMHSLLSILSYFCKAPNVPPGTPLINSLFSQRDCIINILRACIGLPPDNHMFLEQKLSIKIK